MGGDQGDAKGPDGLPPLGSATDHGDDGEMWGRLRVGVSSSRGGNGLRGAPPHRSINQEMADKHSGQGGLSAHLYTVHVGVEDARDDPDGALVGSRRGK